VVYLTQVHFVEVPGLPQGTDPDVAVLSVHKQRLVDVFRRALQFLPETLEDYK